MCLDFIWYAAVNGLGSIFLGLVNLLAMRKNYIRRRSAFVSAPVPVPVAVHCMRGVNSLRRAEAQSNFVNH